MQIPTCFFLSFTPLWSLCCHRNDSPCWDSVASSRQIWMLNPLAKHHSQPEPAMINNPTREIWLGETEAGDLREWGTAMSPLSGPQSDWKSPTEKTGDVHPHWVVSAVFFFFFLRRGLGPKIGSLVGLQLNESWTSCAWCWALTLQKSVICADSGLGNSVGVPQNKKNRELVGGTAGWTERLRWRQCSKSNVITMQSHATNSLSPKISSLSFFSFF